MATRLVAFYVSVRVGSSPTVREGVNAGPYAPP